jgi:hypothetical protein
MRRVLLLVLLVSPASAQDAATAEEKPGVALSVQVGSDGETAVSVTRGEALVKAAGEGTRVRTGQRLEVRRGERPKRKKSILAAPSKLVPKEGEAVATAEVPLSWERVRGARSYHVVIEPEGGGTPAYDGKAEGTSFVVKLPAGSWRWRVSALDPDGLEGKVTPVQRFTVDVTPPKLKTGKPSWK